MREDVLPLASTEIRPSDFLDYRLFLASLYAYLKKKVGKYSYHKFAEDLSFGHSTVIHQIVKGYRPLSKKGAERISKSLSLSSGEHGFFMLLVGYCNAVTAAQKQLLLESLVEIKRRTLPVGLDKDCLAYFSAWYHPVVRELVASPNFQNDPEWLAKKLTPQISVEQASACLELLLRLGYISVDPDSGRLSQTKVRVSTGHRVENLALMNYHQAMLTHAQEALTNISSERRDISALTVCVNEEEAQRLRSLIHAFQLQLLDAAEKAGPGEQVFQINIQLFPFTI